MTGIRGYRFHVRERDNPSPFFVGLDREIPRMIQTRDYKRIHEMRKVNWEDTREMHTILSQLSQIPSRDVPRMWEEKTASGLTTRNHGA